MKLEVTWQMRGYVDVPKNDVENAMKYFENNSDYIELPTVGEYVDGSLELSTYDPDEIFEECPLPTESDWYVMCQEGFSALCGA